MAKLINFVKAHFASEEEMFRKTDYFDMDGHIVVHARFVSILEKLYHDAIINPRILCGSAEVIRNSIVTHIEVEESLFNKMISLPNLK
jgi:hemerythrin